MANEDWISKLLENEAPQLKRIALALLADEATADDVVQEVWIKAMHQDVASLQNPRAWLQAVTRNTARMVWRTSRRTLEAEHRGAQRESYPSAGEELAQESARRALVGALEALPKLQREVVRLRYLEGMALNAVAERLGRPVATIKWQAHQGLDRLRRMLDRESTDRQEWSFALIGAWSWSKAELAAAGVPVKALGFQTSAWMLWFLLGACLFGVLGLRIWGGQRQVLAAIGPPSSLQAVAVPTEVVAPSLAGRQSTPGVEPSPMGTPAERSAATTVEVKVVRSDGSPVHGATIMVTDTKGRIDFHRVRSDASGVAMFDASQFSQVTDSDEKHVSLVAWGPQLARSQVYVVNLKRTGRKTLTLAGPGLTFAGTARSPEGLPLSGVQLTLGEYLNQIEVTRDRIDGLMRIEPRFTTSADDGTFAFHHVAEGSYELLALLPSFTPRLDRIRVDKNCEGIVLVLDPGRTVRGRVLNRDQEPYPGAQVYVRSTATGKEGNRVTSDSQGRFEIGGLSRTRPSELWAVTENGGARRILEAGATPPRDLVLQLGDEHKLDIQITDRRGPTDERRVTVTTPQLSWQYSALSDPNGKLAVLDAASGPLLIQVFDRQMGRPVAIGKKWAVAGSGKPIAIDCDGIPSVGTPFVHGTLLTEVGHVPDSGELRLVEPGSLVGIRIPIDQATGGFEYSRMAAGTHELLFTGSNSGFVRLAQFDVDWAERLDLGLLRVPATAELRPLDRLPPSTTPSEEWSLQADFWASEGQGQPYEVLRGPWPPPPSIKVLPGRYAFRRNGAGTAPSTEFVFEVLPGQTYAIGEEGQGTR